MGNGMRLSIYHGVCFHGLKHGGDDLFCFDFRKIYRLIDSILLLYRLNTVLAGLSQIETGPAGRTQLGDHLFVVGVGGFYRNAGFGLEFVDQLLGGITFPGQQFQCFGTDRGGNKGQEGAQEMLTQSAIKGGAGKWGPIPMPAKGGTAITDDQVKTVAAYVWTLSQ